MTFVTHGTLGVARSAERDYELARAYLCRVPCERAIFHRLEDAAGGRHYRLMIDRRGDDRFDPNTNTIYWDPYSALRTARGGTQSPALVWATKPIMRSNRRRGKTLWLAPPTFDTIRLKSVV